jgi:hypothetical protein
VAFVIGRMKIVGAERNATAAAPRKSASLRIA